MSQDQNLPHQGILIEKMHAFLRLEDQKQLAVERGMIDIQEKIVNKDPLSDEEEASLRKFLGLSNEKTYKQTDIIERIDKSLEASEYKIKTIGHNLKTIQEKINNDSSFDNLNRAEKKVLKTALKLEGGKEYDPVDVSKQISDVLNELGYKDPANIIDKEGVCQGLSVLWSYGKILQDKGVTNDNTGVDDINFMRDTANKLANWDGKSELEDKTTKDINRFISNIRTHQYTIEQLFVGDEKTINELKIKEKTVYIDELFHQTDQETQKSIDSKDINQSLNYLNDYTRLARSIEKNASDNPLKHRMLDFGQESKAQGLAMFESTGNNVITNINSSFNSLEPVSKKTISAQLDKFLQANKMCILSIHGEQGAHAISAYKNKEGKIFFYDPNIGEKEFNNTAEVSQEIVRTSKSLFPEMKKLVNFRAEVYDLEPTKKTEIQMEVTKPKPIIPKDKILDVHTETASSAHPAQINAGLKEKMRDAIKAAKNNEKRDKLNNKIEKLSNHDDVLEVLVDASKHTGIKKIFGSHSLNTNSAQKVLKVIKENTELLSSVKATLANNAKPGEKFEKQLQNYIKTKVAERKTQTPSR